MKEHIFEYDDMFTEPLGLPHFPKEEVVRCRDCKHYEDYSGCCYRRYQPMAVTSDGFCAWGERRD